MNAEPIPYVVTTMSGRKSTTLATTPEEAVAVAAAATGVPIRDIYRVLPFDHPIEIRARKKNSQRESSV